MGLLSGLRSALSFLTILPFGQGAIEEMAKYAFFFPLVGTLIGAISGSIGVGLFRLLDHTFAGWCTLLVLLSLTGLNHLDGVLDLGDALMIRGSKERRLEILHDKHHGIGGFSALFFVLVLTGSLLALLGDSTFAALIIAETLGKNSMVVAGGLGKPHSKGVGSIFISKLKERLLANLFLGVAIAFTITLAFSSLVFCRVFFSYFYYLPHNLGKVP